MKLIARILLLAVLVGPQFGEMVPPPEPQCEESGNCCTPHGLCDVNCDQCACCAIRMTSLTPAEAAEPLDSPPAQAAVVAIGTPPPPPPTDILHVPKSI